MSVTLRQSLISTVKRCERKAWYAMRDVEGVSHKGVRAGSAVHKILDELAKGTFDVRAYPADEKTAIALNVARALYHAIPSSWSLLASEIPFAISHNSDVWNGTIDRIYRSSHYPWILVDTKTVHSFPPLSKGVRDYGLQPFLYALAIMQSAEVDSIPVFYWYATRPKSSQDIPKTMALRAKLSREECESRVNAESHNVVKLRVLSQCQIWEAPRNSQACFDFGKCQYWQQCYGTAGND